MITQFFKVPHGHIPVANLRLHQRMGDKDEYRLDIETAPPEPQPSYRCSTCKDKKIIPTSDHIGAHCPMCVMR